MLRARIEMTLAVVTGILAVLTLAWPTWIESIFGVDPDARSGAAEWWVVLVLAGTAVTSGLLARREYRAARRRSSDGV